MKLKRKKKEYKVLYIYIYKVYYKTKMKNFCYICWEKVSELYMLGKSRY